VITSKDTGGRPVSSAGTVRNSAPSPSNATTASLVNLFGCDVDACHDGPSLRESQREKADAGSEVEDLLAWHAYPQRLKQLEEAIGIIRPPGGIVGAGLSPIERVALVYAANVRHGPTRF
jgi:hypothetical protein